MLFVGIDGELDLSDLPMQIMLCCSLLIPFLSLKLFVLGRENAFWCFDFKCWRFFSLSGSWLVLERLFLWMMVLGFLFCLQEANIGGGLKS